MIEKSEIRISKSETISKSKLLNFQNFIDFLVSNFGHRSFGFISNFGFRALDLTLLMPEVSHPCKDHGNVVFICGGDHLIVSNRATGLDDG